MVPRALGTPADDSPRVVLGSFPMGRELRSRVTPACEVSGAESSAHVACCCTAGHRWEGWWKGQVGSKAQRMSRSHPFLEGSVASLSAGLFYLLSLGGGVSEDAALLRARQGWRTDGKTVGLLSPRAALGRVPPSGPQHPPTLAFISWCSVLSV